MGRKGRGCFSEKAEEEEGRHGGAGKGPEQPGTAEQVRHHPPVLGWAPTGLSQERLTPCHLLSCLALARFTESS